ncbi:MAG: radical SAM protein [Armatimonadetes bacterium]|nr:radical SAM protein [Armatimonadota bacterium]
MRTTRPPRIACKRESLVITVFDGEEAIYTFDHAGRFWSAWAGYRLYRRALDGRVMRKHTDRSGRHPRRHRSFLEGGARAAITDATARAAAAALLALRSGTAEILWSLPGEPDAGRAAALLEAAARFDAGAAEADAQRFASVYAPVPILPPDRYRSLVVQVTEGCHWNRCTFCSFYRTRPFRIKPLDEFASHLGAVRAFFGPGLTLRRGAFLGDANALLLPVADLIPRLDLLARALPEHAGDLAAFIDVFTGHRRDCRDLATLRARGLRRIYLGLESGDDRMLEFLNKPQSAEEAIGLAHAAREAGLAVGIIVMAGIGGDAFWPRHVEATLAAIRAMDLGAGDLLYVSAFAAPREGPYAERAMAAGVKSLTEDEVWDQVDELVSGSRAVLGAGARVARYDIEEFIY